MKLNTISFAVLMLFSTGLYAQTFTIDDLTKEAEKITALHLSSKETINQNIEAPIRAESGAQVPIKINIPLNTQNITLSVEGNPFPLVFSFDVSKLSSEPSSIETRIRMEKDSNVIALLLNKDGSYSKSTFYIKASGGCGGGVLDDEKLTRAESWKTKIQQKEGAISVLVRHPIYTGLQRDSYSGGTRTAWWIKTLSILNNNENVISGEMGVGISENPYFKITSPLLKDTKISLKMTDNEGTEHTSN